MVCALKVNVQKKKKSSFFVELNNTCQKSAGLCTLQFWDWLYFNGLAELRRLQWVLCNVSGQQGQCQVPGVRWQCRVLGMPWWPQVHLGSRGGAVSCQALWRWPQQRRRLRPAMVACYVLLLLLHCLEIFPDIIYAALWGYHQLAGNSEVSLRTCSSSAESPTRNRGTWRLELRPRSLDKFSLEPDADPSASHRSSSRFVEHFRMPISAVWLLTCLLCGTPGPATSLRALLQTFKGLVSQHPLPLSLSEIDSLSIVVWPNSQSALLL